MTNFKIPFWIAIFININIVIGSGFFLESQHISATCGVWAPLVWIACGFMLLPLVLVLAHLAKKFPTAGGLYVYSKQALGDQWGFLSGWAYFIGTTAGNTVLIHAFSQAIQHTPLYPHLAAIGLHTISLDILFIILFTLINFLNVQIFEKAQILFTILKTIPIMILIIGAFFLFDSQYYVTTTPFVFNNFLGAIPLVLFSYIGIEACCAIVDQIEGNRGYLAIIISFIVIVLTYSILQALIFCAHGPANINPFLNILPQIIHNPTIALWGNKIITIAITSSYLGGFYSMFYCNNWNLFAIAQDNLLAGSSQLTQKNKHGIPWLCVIAQGALIITFLLITHSNHPLETMCNFGALIAYLLSAAAFFVFFRNRILSILSFITCSIFLYVNFQDLLSKGLRYLAPFLIIIFMGLIWYSIKKPRVKTLG
ncbi:MAG: APC family permease [bacterium]